VRLSAHANILLASANGNIFRPPLATGREPKRDMPTLDDLHVAMGRFLTESSIVENGMFAIFAMSQRERSSDDVFSDFMDKTFGDKIKAFKNVCNAHPFGDTHRAILNEVYDELDALLPKRNFIVHGTTLEAGNHKIPSQPYRIGKRKGQADRLMQAISDDLVGPHVFTTDSISKVTGEFAQTKYKLQRVVTDMVRFLPPLNMSS
jgi:hypothetical protein